MNKLKSKTKLRREQMVRWIILITFLLLSAGWFLSFYNITGKIRYWMLDKRGIRTDSPLNIDLKGMQGVPEKY